MQDEKDNGGEDEERIDAQKAPQDELADAYRLAPCNEEARQQHEGRERRDRDAVV
ncbi:hypothetical protein D3C87_2027630 [compost metagenome]